MSTWTTKTGEKLNIRDMETSHIENCIRMLDRNLNEVQNFIANWEWEWGSLTFSQAAETEEKLEKKLKSLRKELKGRDDK